jgi:hypothetical protein
MRRSRPGTRAALIALTATTAVVLGACAPPPPAVGAGSNDDGSPAGPVTYSAELASDRTFVNQSTSFTSSAGTVSSRRPQASEPEATSLFAPTTQGLPEGVEWRLLWLRAKNCESVTRRIEFFVQQEQPVSVTVRRFVQGDSWVAGEPVREVQVGVAPGGELGWVGSTDRPLVIGPGQSIGARFHDMAGGSEGCNWQFGAIQQPAGTGVALHHGATTPMTTQVAGSFTSDRAGRRVSWRTVPEGQYWVPESVTATNCESAPRRIDVVLLGPGDLTHGVVGGPPDGSGPATVRAGATFEWDASRWGGSRLALPAGWSLGVRWHDLDGSTPSARCSWEANFSVGGPGGPGAAFDAVFEAVLARHRAERCTQFGRLGPREPGGATMSAPHNRGSRFAEDPTVHRPTCSHGVRSERARWPAWVGGLSSTPDLFGREGASAHCGARFSRAEGKEVPTWRTPDRRRSRWSTRSRRSSNPPTPRCSPSTAGLTVRDLAELRSSMREAGGEYRVYKNTLVRRAAQQLDLELDDELVGPTAIAFVGQKPRRVAR